MIFSLKQPALTLCYRWMRGSVGYSIQDQEDIKSSSFQSHFDRSRCHGGGEQNMGNIWSCLQSYAHRPSGPLTSDHNPHSTRYFFCLRQDRTGTSRFLQCSCCRLSHELHRNHRPLVGQLNFIWLHSNKFSSDHELKSR